MIRRISTVCLTDRQGTRGEFVDRATYYENIPVEISSTMRCSCLGNGLGLATDARTANRNRQRLWTAHPSRPPCPMKIADDPRHGPLGPQELPIDAMYDNQWRWVRRTRCTSGGCVGTDGDPYSQISDRAEARGAQLNATALVQEGRGDLGCSCLLA